MLEAEKYLISSYIFPRLLGIIYFIVFSGFLFQIRGLIGERGILPLQPFLQNVKRHLGNKSTYRFPTLFWISTSNSFLLGVTGTGIFLSFLLTFDLYTSWVLVGLFIIQLSIVYGGQEFLSFGWEMFLLEVTLYAFLLSLTHIPNTLVWIGVNLLIARFHFQSGIVKLQSQDKNWRNLTGVAYHYLTQPLPNTIAWYAHKLPLSLQKVSCFLMLFIEMFLPILVFGDETMRMFVFACFFGLQFMIWLTGNFAYLNHLTVTLCLLLVSDTYLIPIFGAPSPPAETPLFLEIGLTIIGALLVTLQIMNLWNHFMPISIFQWCLSWVAPFHIVNRYGIFAVMTTKRNEIVVEGSVDGHHWKEYLFYWKPSELNRRPRRISPFQPRLDWSLWFLPFRSFEQYPWFRKFLEKLLEGSPEVLQLLRHNPFPDHPPKYIRALSYDYVYTTAKTKKETGNWWERTYTGVYSPTLMLKKSLYLEDEATIESV